METLSAIEARIIGVLIEKAFTTPDQYPLSLNAVVAACNQRSNREPVMSVTDDDALDALQTLRSGGWVTVVMPSSGRVERYRHHVRDKLELDGLQQAVLAELLLRGPQTAGELRTRCGRMKPFESLEAAQNVVRSLAEREDGEPLAKKLPPAPGGRAERWTQLLCPRDEAAPMAPSPTASEGPMEEETPGLAQRVAALEARVEALERRLGGE